MLTLQKKGGHKDAVGPKAKLGVIMGIQDGMPAYRVLSFENREKLMKIPFAQVVSHEGHYPFRDYNQWTEEEKLLPESFIPSIQAHGNDEEWKKFSFLPAEVSELEGSMLFAPAAPVSREATGSATGSATASDQSQKLPPLEPEYKVELESQIREPVVQTDAVGATGPHSDPPGKPQSKSYDLRPSKDPIYRPPPQFYRPRLTTTAPPESKDVFVQPLGQPKTTTQAAAPQPADLGVSPSEGNVPWTLSPQTLSPRQGANRDEDSIEPDEDACIYTRVLDPDDLSLPVILSYRTRTLQTPIRAKVSKVSPTDATTKPISIPAPCNRKEALASPWWPGYYNAELAEMESLRKNGTWKLIPRSEVPRGVNVLRDRWAYSDKLTLGGTSNEKFKARLTCMGCFQRAGVDYTDTYASVMNTRTFRMLLQLYNSQEENSMVHWDVSTAFIHAPLEEKVT